MYIVKIGFDDSIRLTFLILKYDKKKLFLTINHLWSLLLGCWGKILSFRASFFILF